MAEYIVDFYCKTKGVKCEPVVRCMNCKHFTNDSEHGAWCNWFMRSLNDDYDGFCAWASRKEVDA